MASVSAMDIVTIIVDIIRFTLKITHHLHNLHKATADEVELDRRLLIELPRLVRTLSSVKQILEDDRPGNQDMLRHLLPIFTACGTDFKKLYDIFSRTLPRPDGNSSGQAGRKANEDSNSYASITELMQQLQGYTKKFSFYSAVYSVGNDVNKELKIKELMAWLSPLDVSQDYQTLVKRQPGTGQWLLTHKRYIEWRKNPGLIWLYGLPGSGKTILCSAVLEDIERYVDRDPGRAILYFFFEFKDPRKQGARSMVSLLISRLLRRAAHIPKSLEGLHETCRLAVRRPSLDELLTVLKDMIQHFPETFLIIDALDECADRMEMARVVTAITNWRFLKLHVLLTSRKQYGIGGASEGLLPESGKLYLRSDLVVEDIKHFVRGRLKKDAGTTVWNNDTVVREPIETIISKDSHGIFRLAFCQLDALGKCENQAAMAQVLQSLPLTLDEAYDRILCDFPPEEIVYTRHILMWLAFAWRPLYVEEVAEIMAIHSDGEPADGFKAAPEDPLELSVTCSALVGVRPEHNRVNSEARLVVTLAHHSVKEHLLSNRIPKGPATVYSLNRQECHKIIAKACISLLSRKTTYPGAEKGSLHSDSILVEYAKDHWLDHVRAITVPSEEVDELVAEMLTQNDRHSNWQQLFDSETRSRQEYSKSLLEDIISSIHFASYFGLSTILERLVQMQDANTRVYDVSMRTHSPLALAASQGHTEAMRMLIKNGAPVCEGHGNLHREPLIVAIRAAQVKAVELLLREGAYADSQYLRSLPLQEAIDTGSAQLASLLIDRGADIASLGLGTPLHRASERGHKRIVKLLLDNDAVVDGEVTTGNLHCHGTALCAAAMRGHIDVVSMLLDWGADVNSGPKLRPLIEAATRGNRDVVEVLLRRGADPNLTGTTGLTALRLALQHGHQEIAWLLISYGANLGQSDGQFNVLHDILERGYDGLAAVLIQRGYVDASQGRTSTALPIACAHGCEEVVSAILLQQDVDVNETHLRYGTALQAAAAASHWNIVRLLLANNADPNCGLRSLATPLQLACAKGNEETVLLLLRHGADEDSRGFAGEDPLQLACLHGHENIVRLLLEHDTDA